MYGFLNIHFHGTRHQRSHSITEPLWQSERLHQSLRHSGTLPEWLHPKNPPTHAQSYVRSLLISICWIIQTIEHRCWLGWMLTFKVSTGRRIMSQFHGLKQRFLPSAGKINHPVVSKLTRVFFRCQTYGWEIPDKNRSFSGNMIYKTWLIFPSHSFAAWCCTTLVYLYWHIPPKITQKWNANDK